MGMSIKLRMSWRAPWIIIEYSAGIVGGCTRGLAISGTMQLSPAGLIFIVGLFVSGIIKTSYCMGGIIRMMTYVVPILIGFFFAFALKNGAAYSNVHAEQSLTFGSLSGHSVATKLGVKTDDNVVLESEVGKVISNV